MSVATTNGAGPQVEANPADAKALAELARIGRVSKLRTEGWVVELSGGQRATMCDPALLTERQRRHYKVVSFRVGEARRNATDRDQAAAVVVASDDHLITTFLREWTLDLPLPTQADADSLQDIPGPDYDHLVWVCNDLIHDAFVGFEPELEPSSPFAASSD